MPVSPPAVSDLIIAQSLLLAVVLQSALVGRRLSKLVGFTAAERSNFYLETFISISLGLAVDIAVLFALGISCLLYPQVVAVSYVILLLLSLPRVSLSKISFGEITSRLRAANWVPCF